MAVPTNPCSDVQTVFVDGGGSYTISLPSSLPGQHYSVASNTPIGTVSQKLILNVKTNSYDIVNMLNTGTEWVVIDVGDCSEYTPKQLEEKMREIEVLFNFMEQAGIDNFSGVTLEDKTREYNVCEERLIGLQEENPLVTVELGDQAIDTGPGSVYDTMMKPMIEEAKRTAEEIKRNLDERT